MELKVVKQFKIGKHTHKFRRKLFSLLCMSTLVLFGLLNLTQGDYAEAALGATETTETNLGTITIPTQGVSRIVGIYGITSIQTTTVAEGVSGHFRLSFSTVAGVFKFPVTIFQGAAGTLADIGPVHAAQIIPVNIPVPSKETVTCYMTLNLAQTGTCRGMVGLIME